MPLKPFFTSFTMSLMQIAILQPVHSAAQSVHKQAIALGPEWRLRLEDQVDLWRIDLLYVAAKFNSDLTLQLSYRTIGRMP